MDLVINLEWRRMYSLSHYWQRLSPALKLTIAYLSILMLISLFFSIVLYNLAANQLESSLRRQYVKLTPGSTIVVPRGPNPVQVAEEVENARQNLLLELIYFNAIILALSGAISYLLARQTVKPIQDALEAQSRFTADASHELRTPLAAMQTEIEIALRANKISTSEARELLQSNLEEVIKLRNLSDGLLRLARADSDGKNLTTSKINLNLAVKEAIKRVAVAAKNKKIIITNEVKKVSVYAEKDSLIELIVILLDNSIKYSQKKAEVKITYSTSPNHIKLSIADSGPGIAKKDLEHIFERFYRADNSRTKKSGSGYGLGLSIAAKIAQLHGGSIGVKSAIGKGSVFTVVLPKNNS